MKVKYICQDCGLKFHQIHSYQNTVLCWRCYSKKFNLVPQVETIDKAQQRIRHVFIGCPKRKPYGIIRVSKVYIGKKVRVVVVEDSDDK
jgi:DNA-directed RNA polymerase subunit RPC12/RpoP